MNEYLERAKTEMKMTNSHVEQYYIGPYTGRALNMNS